MDNALVFKRVVRVYVRSCTPVLNIRMTVSVRWVHTASHSIRRSFIQSLVNVFSMPGLEGRRKPKPRTRKAITLHEGIQQASHT